MSENEKTNEQSENAALPLTAAPPVTARLKKKLVMGLLGVLATAALISLVWSLKQPAPKTQQEVKKESSDASGQKPPALPDTLTGSPSSYGDLKKGETDPKLAGTQAGKIDLTEQQRNAGNALLEAGGGKPTYTTYAEQPGQQQGTPQLTPAQQAKQAAAEQRRKEYQDALRSGLTFGGNGSAAPQVDSQQGMPRPNIPDIDVDAMTRKVLGQSSDDDQNRQNEKRSFSSTSRNNSPYLLAALQPPISKYEVKAGTIIPGLLITGINSDLPGQITAQVRENVYDTVTGRYLLIPQGTRLIGDYDSKVTYAQDRALVVWNRIILPNGSSISLEGMPGVDLSGYAGLNDRVNNHYAKLVTGVVLGSVIGAGAQVATGGQGSANNPASFSQIAVSGAAQNMNNAGQQITQKNLSIQPTITIRPGWKLNVFVTKDIILKPYNYARL